MTMLGSFDFDVIRRALPYLFFEGMNAPSVAPITAIQVFVGIAGAAGAAGVGRAVESAVGWSVVIGVFSRLPKHDALGGRFR